MSWWMTPTLLGCCWAAPRRGRIAGGRELKKREVARTGPATSFKLWLWQGASGALSGAAERATNWSAGESAGRTQSTCGRNRSPESRRGCGYGDQVAKGEPAVRQSVAGRVEGRGLIASCDIGAVGWEFGDLIDSPCRIECGDRAGSEVGGWIVYERNVRQADLAEVTDSSFDRDLYDATR